MRILLTGVHGLLGRQLAEQLHHRGHEVWGVARKLVPGDTSGVTLVEIDLSEKFCSDELPNDVEIVIHLAQSSRFRDFPDSAIDVFNVNIASTARMLDYAKQVGAKHFVYASSGGVYGNGSQAFKENAAVEPAGKLGYYLGSKACGEILVQSYASLFKVTIIRPFFIYGPGQDRSMLIPRLMDSVALGKPISLQGSKGIHINPVHVEDAAATVIATLDARQGAIYNVAGPDVLSIRQIAEVMGEHLGKAPMLEQAEGVPKDLIADISLMQEKLWKPKRKLWESLKDIAL